MIRLILTALIGGLVTMFVLPCAGGAEVGVEWENPTMNKDGSPLTDLAAVRVHFGTASNALTQAALVPTTEPGKTVLEVVTGLTKNQTYWFAVEAVDTDGNTSGLTAAVSGRAKTWPNKPEKVRVP